LWREAFLQRIRRSMRANNVLDVIQNRDSDHRQLATLSVDLSAVAHGLIKIEPSARQCGAVQHQAVDVYKPARPSPFDLGDEFGEFRMLFFFDQRYTRHMVPF